MQIVLATRNKKKIDEIRRITAGLPVAILSLGDFPHCPDVVEDSDSFEGNARKKAIEICQCTGKPALADDSGLEVEALHGAPGIYSARYAGGAGEVDDAKNNAKLLAELRNVEDSRRGAQFVCCIALAFPDGEVKTFLGIAPGRIIHEPRGTNGFGYNPIFIPEGHSRTFAEMSGEEKDKLSHRGKALMKLREFINANFI
ncbi:MAG TPA: XTP/dITP diphosphatase [Nitrospirota bacterium]|nr:XTP/dITP diphosphatase [Nitrospirota bacterium]